MSTNHIQKYKRGSALVLVTLTITSILLMVLGVSRLIVPQLEQNRELIDASIADYAAKAGSAYVIENLNSYMDMTGPLEQHINLAGGGACDTNNRTDKCFKVSAQPQHDQYGSRIYRVANLDIASDNGKINQILFAKMNSIRQNNDFNGVLPNFFYYNPNPAKATYTNPQSLPCNYFRESLKDLLDDYRHLLRDSMNDNEYYDVLYLTNSSTVSGNASNGVINLADYFSTARYSNGPNAITLLDYLNAGGHLFIDNAYGATITGLPPELAFNWNNTSTYSDRQNDENSGYINPIGKDNVFKYLYQYASATPGKTVEQLIRLIEDEKFPWPGSADKKFGYVTPPGGFASQGSNAVATNHPFWLGEGNGKFEEMLGYPSSTPNTNDDHANIIRKDVGENGGWIVATSSSPASAIVAQGSGTDISSCTHVGSPNDSKLPPPYLFVFSLTDFAARLGDIKVTGYYGGIQRTYRLQTELIRLPTGGWQTKRTWVEVVE